MVITVRLYGQMEYIVLVASKNDTPYCLSYCLVVVDVHIWGVP